MAEFNSLDQIFNMFTPTDLVGAVEPTLGSSVDKVDNALIALLKIIENSGRGVRSVEAMKTSLQDLATHKTDKKTGASLDAGIKLNDFLSFYSNLGFVEALGKDCLQAADPTKGNALTAIDKIEDILGPTFKSDPNFNYSILLSKSPFFHPNNRNTRRVEIFLNSMPATVVSQLVPFLDAEFQISRPIATKLQSPGLLKFLIGAADVKDGTDANDLMIAGHQINAKDKKGVEGELDFAGMEMFTTPQTLVNPQPNESVGAKGARYVPVQDPFRPFASLESVTISQPQFTVGVFAHKKCNMVIKLHDRSRLAEISDFIRPKVYTGVTIWMTYGWRAPVRNGENPYFDYINNNMLMREAYGIQNCSIAFDNIGQVTVNLELFTKGVSELQQLLISDTTEDAQAQIKRMQILSEKLNAALQAANLANIDGPSKEIRAFQVIQSAQSGELPPFNKADTQAAIAGLDKLLRIGGTTNPTAISNLKKVLNDIYGDSSAKQADAKLNFKERLDSTVTQTINKQFQEALTGKDPFLPVPGKTNVDAKLAKQVADFNKAPTTKVTKFKNSVVSFGKLFSVFALKTIVHAGIADEVQIFFYALNSQCGPVSSHSVAEFPVEMAVFLDQYREQCVQKGSDKMTLDDFLLLLRNSQFTDNRAIGYGLRSAYKPYDPASKDAVVEDKQGKGESMIAKSMLEYGTFKMPTIEMYVETSHESSSELGDNDVLEQLNYSARDAKVETAKDLKAKSSKRIMRFHIYDKQTDSNVAATSLAKAENTSGEPGFVQNPSTSTAKKLSGQTNTDPLNSVVEGQAKTFEAIPDSTGVSWVGSFDNQKIKDTVSKLMPTIIYGSNGTTIFNAALSSKADPLLTAANLTRGFSTRNDAAPNGSGELGIPLRVIPAQLTVNTLGCPLATMAQKFFIDFGTGTTLDNVYVVTGLSHTFSPGKFETSWTFAFHDAYGVFQDAPNITKRVKALLEKTDDAFIGKFNELIKSKK